MKRRPRPKAVLLVLLLVTMINLPIVHSTWTRWKVERSGTDVTAPVVGNDVLGSAGDPEYYVSFRLSREIDPDQHAWPVQLDKASYDEAVASRTLDVRVLPDQPSAYTVDGQVTSRLGLVITLLADLALLVMVALAWRFRGSLRPQLRAVATGDVERCKPGSALDKLEGDDLPHPRRGVRDRGRRDRPRPRRPVGGRRPRRPPQPDRLPAARAGARPPDRLTGG